MLKIKLFSPWHTKELNYDGVCFSPLIELSNSDGALWEYFPPDETILKFSGVKAWYFWEPSWHSLYKTKMIKKIKQALTDKEILYYGHPDPTYRVPHITNCNSTNDLFYVTKGERKQKAIAIVSNHGGRRRFFSRDFQLRNKFVTNNQVDLFGKKSSWENYNLFHNLPENYKGELNWEGGWLSENQIKFMSQYKVVVCLENSIEPFYFTEKFVNAVCAGSIPIYHAHSTIRDGILQDAKYIDPVEYGFDPKKTLQAALNAPLEEFQSKNSEWLKKLDVKQTYFDGVWSKLANIFKLKYSEIYNKN